MHQPSINRRQLLQRVAALSIGAGILPFTGYPLPHHTNQEPATVYIPSGEGKKGKVGDMQLTFKLSGRETSDLLGSWESIIQPGELGAPPHYHAKTDEICRVLEGTVTIMTGDTITEVKAGGWHLRPRGLVHTFWNAGATVAKTIDLCIPGGHEYYMQELALLFEKNNRPKPGDLKRLEEKHDIHYRFDLLPGVMEKYGVKL